MVYGVILAGGVGKRMGLDIPKQYIKIDGKPIIIYTVEALLKCASIDKIYIAVAKDWLEDVKAMLSEFCSDEEIANITMVEGGAERIDTIMNAQDAIIRDHGVSSNDVVLFHDAVRPFVPNYVLKESIEGAIKYKAAVAGLKVVDTILSSDDGLEVNQILDRDKIYLGQAPDSFNLKYFVELGEVLTDEQKKQITGTSQFCSFNNKPIFITKGDELNFKITTIDDLEKAKEIVKGRI